MNERTAQAQAMFVFVCVVTACRDNYSKFLHQLLLYLLRLSKIGFLRLCICNKIK